MAAFEKGVYTTVELVNEYGQGLGVEYCRTEQAVREAVLQILEIVGPGDKIEFGTVEI